MPHHVWNLGRALPLVLLCAAPFACKEEAGPRPGTQAEERCRLGPSPSLEAFCDSAAFRGYCEHYERYDDALAYALDQCAETGFPVALGACDQRVIDRFIAPSGVVYYFDAESGELEGVRVIEDQLEACPPGSERDETPPVITAGDVDEDCAVCHTCGVTLTDREVCEGELAGPYVEQCMERFDFAPGCAECACDRCFPWTFTGIEDTALMFHECVSEHCAEPCAAAPDEDGGIETDEDGGA